MLRQIVLSYKVRQLTLFLLKHLPVDKSQLIHNIYMKSQLLESGGLGLLLSKKDLDLLHQVLMLYLH